ncbi:MAG: hypothetical protein AAFV54_01870, partial [Pseudomonadota bacterium]
MHFNLSAFLAALLLCGCTNLEAVPQSILADDAEGLNAETKTNGSVTNNVLEAITPESERLSIGLGVQALCIICK